MDRKPTKSEILNADGKNLKSIIKPDLLVLFCGINPGLYTAAVGYHYARPGNRFWSTLYRSGFTDRLLKPSESKEMLKYGYGLTNILERATNSEVELTKQELLEGKAKLVKKVLKFKPKVLAVVGIHSYRIAFGKPKAKPGLQEEKIGKTLIWVLPNPSGLNANYLPKDLAKHFKKARLAAEALK